MRGYGHTPLLFTAGFDDEDPIAAHRRFAEVLDEALTMIADIKRRAREDAAAGRPTPRPAWPMIIFRTPKGWTGPKEVDGQPAEGSWRSHQVRSEEHTSELQSRGHLVCRLLLEKKKTI